MGQVRHLCLDCGKVAVSDQPVEEDRTIPGLCDDCYQKLLKQDPKLARWAFKGDDQAASKK